MSLTIDFYNNEIVIASKNVGKIKELNALLPDWHLLSLDDIGFEEDIPEPFETFKENAQQKAKTIFDFCGKTVLADDSGLCVPSLNGLPGVHSAFYGGHPRSDEKNNELLLTTLKGITQRTAFYKAVICLYSKKGVHFFEGTCEGSIIESARGNDGFGYDPLFVPCGFTQTFAELPLAIKNKLSHRGIAIEKLKQFLDKEMIL